MAAGLYTAVGCTLWTWRPLRSLKSAAAKLLWVGFYTSAESRRLVPGLWQGNLHSMADMTGMDSDDTWGALQNLIEHRLVEFDAHERIVRLTTLPDQLERAHNAKTLRGWWLRFQTLTDCAIRNAHVPLLWWLQFHGKPRAQDMNDAWQQTFGTIPAASGYEAPSASDTSTDVQPSLFSATTTASVPGLVSQPRESLSIGLSIPLSIPNGSDPDPDLDHDPDPDPEGESVRGGSDQPLPEPSSGHRPALVPFSVADLLRVVAVAVPGDWMAVLADSHLRQALERDIAALEAPDLQLLGEYLRATRTSHRSAVEILSSGAHLANAFSQARDWLAKNKQREQEAAEKMAFLQTELHARGL